MTAHNDEVCSKYNERVLPDEQGKCSLCGATLRNAKREKLVQFLHDEGYRCEASYIDSVTQVTPFHVDEYSNLGIEVRFTSRREYEPSE